MKSSLCSIVPFILISYNSNSQQSNTDIYDRRDSVVTLDMEKNITDTKIIKYTVVFIDAENCNSLPLHFIAKTCRADVAQLKKLSAIEFRCNGIFQRYWEDEWDIKAFNLRTTKKNQSIQSIINQSSEFGQEIKEVLVNLKSGENIVFENIILVHPKRGTAAAEFSMQVK